MFAILAAIAFGLATFGPNSIGPIELVPLGLLFVAVHLVVGAWPSGIVFRRPTQ